VIFANGQMMECPNFVRSPIVIGFIQYRALRTRKDRIPPKLAYLVELSNQLCSEVGIPADDLETRESYVCKLISLTNESGHTTVTMGLLSDEMPPSYKEKRDRDLFVAAIGTSHIKLVTKLLPHVYEEWYSTSKPFIESALFGNAFEVAGRAGNCPVIKLLLNNIWETAGAKLWRTNIDRVFQSAANAGHVQAFRLLLRNEWISYELNDPPGPVEKQCHPLARAPYVCGSKAIFVALMSHLKSHPRIKNALDPVDLAQMIRSQAKPGREAFLEYLLNKYTKRPTARLGKEFLQGLCKMGTVDIVGIFLDHVGYQFRDIGAVAHAAIRGHVQVVRLLLDRGYDVDAIERASGSSPGSLDRSDKKDSSLAGWPAIIQAVELEDEALFRLLRDNGASLHGKFARQAILISKKGGSDSMLKLLIDEGLDDTCYRCSGPQWQGTCASVEKHVCGRPNKPDTKDGPEKLEQDTKRLCHCSVQA
jgi:hypothetical protein